MAAVFELESGDARFLAGFLATLVSWDARAAVRVHIRNNAVGIFAAPPTDTLAFVAIPLLRPAPPTERVVSAGRLRDVLGDVSRSGRGPHRIQIPDAVSMPFELGSLPPASGWVAQDSEPAGLLADQLRAHVESFKSLIPDAGGLDRAKAERTAQDVWSRPCWLNVPVRSVHTAAKLGWLAKPDVAVHCASTEQWVRLATPSGQIFATSGAGRLQIPMLD